MIYAIASRRGLKSQPSQSLFELGRSLEWYIGRRVADQDLELSSLGLPVVSAVVPELERISIELDRDRLFLSGLEIDLGESLELLDRSSKAALDVTDVDLNDLLAVDLASVLDLDRDFELAFSGDRGDGEVGHVEGRVRETMSEGPEGFGLRLLKVSVSDKDVFLVEGLAVRSRGDSESNVGGRVGKAFTTGGKNVVSPTCLCQCARPPWDLRERQRQLARRVELAEQDVGKTATDIVSSIKGLDDGSGLLDPRHGHGGSRLVDDDGVGRYGQDGRNELVRGSGQARGKRSECGLATSLVGPFSALGRLTPCASCRTPRTRNPRSDRRRRW
jgi:hypothetical protein